MSWKPFIVQSAAAATVGTGIGVGLRKRTGSDVAARMALTIKESVAHELGFSAETPITILLGDGDDHGVIRLQKGGDEAFAQLVKKGTTKGVWFELMLGVVPQYVDRAEPKAWCQWEPLEDGGGVEIILPSWAEETRPNRKERVSPPIPLAATRQPQHLTGARSATIAGDPPPGRSALDQKRGG